MFINFPSKSDGSFKNVDFESSITSLAIIRNRFQTDVYRQMTTCTVDTWPIPKVIESWTIDSIICEYNVPGVPGSIVTALGLLHLLMF